MVNSKKCKRKSPSKTTRAFSFLSFEIFLFFTTLFLIEQFEVSEMNDQQLKHLALAGLLFLSIFIVIKISFADNVSIGRFLSVAVKPQNEQLNLLQQQIQIKFPQNILTIKQAVKFVLQFSGYQLAKSKQMGQPARAMLDQPLPEVDKTFGPITLEQGLKTLAGATFYLLVDPVHRLIAFQIKPNYYSLYKTLSH